MYCTKCGNPTNDDDQFCMFCGAKINNKKMEDSQIDIASISSSSPVSSVPPASSPKESAIKKTRNVFDRLSLSAFICSAIGIGGILTIAIVGLIGWGRIYFFDGFDFTIIAVILCIVLISFGAITLITRLILILVKKLNGFPSKKITRVFSIILIVLSICCLVWVIIASAEDDNYDDYYYDYGYSSSSSGNSSSSTSLYSAYTQANCSAPWATYDSSYIKIDTNPYNTSGGSSTYSSRALSAIQKLNNIFDVPSYVYNDMISTRAIDGRQSYSNYRISIYWRFHPDSGLEVTYSK